MKIHSEAGIGSRKEREYLARRADILQAAEKLFAGRGFHGATMSDLADLSEFSVGTLYNFFKSKEEVYYTLILGKFDLLQVRLNEEVNKNPAGLSQIRALIETCLLFFQENRGFFQIFIQERSALESSVGAAGGEELRKKYLAYIDLVAKVMAKAIEKGDIQDLNPQELAYSLVGMLNSFVFHWTLYPQPNELILKVPFIFDLFLEGATRSRWKRDA